MSNSTNSLEFFMGNQVRRMSTTPERHCFIILAVRRGINFSQI